MKCGFCRKEGHNILKCDAEGAEQEREKRKESKLKRDSKSPSKRQSPRLSPRLNKSTKENDEELNEEKKEKVIEKVDSTPATTTTNTNNSTTDTTSTKEMIESDAKKDDSKASKTDNKNEAKTNVKSKRRAMPARGPYVPPARRRQLQQQQQQQQQEEEGATRGVEGGKVAKTPEKVDKNDEKPSASASNGKKTNAQLREERAAKRKQAEAAKAAAAASPASPHTSAPPRDDTAARTAGDEDSESSERWGKASQWELDNPQASAHFAKSRAASSSSSSSRAARAGVSRNVLYVHGMGSHLKPRNFDHVLEAFGLLPSLKSWHIDAVLQKHFEDCYRLQWVDDTHCLIVFDRADDAEAALATIDHPVVALRSFDKASPCSRELLLGPQSTNDNEVARPATNAVVARRLIGGALGRRDVHATERARADQQKHAQLKAQRAQQAARKAAEAAARQAALDSAWDD